MILLVDSEGPDQTAWKCKLIWVFAAPICRNTDFRMVHLIIKY